MQTVYFTRHASTPHTIESQQLRTLDSGHEGHELPDENSVSASSGTAWPPSTRLVDISKGHRSLTPDQRRLFNSDLLTPDHLRFAAGDNKLLATNLTNLCQQRSVSFSLNAFPFLTDDCRFNGTPRRMLMVRLQEQCSPG